VRWRKWSVRMGCRDLARVDVIEDFNALTGLLHGWVTSDLWCREVPLEGCALCRSRIRESSEKTSCGSPAAGIRGRR